MIHSQPPFFVMIGNPADPLRVLRNVKLQQRERVQFISTASRLSMHEYELLISQGAFDVLGRRIEMVHGELKEKGPAGPLHGASANDFAIERK